MENKVQLVSEQFKIRCLNCPPELTRDKLVAKEYFRQYGKLKRIIIKQKLKEAVVEYSDRQSYLNALNNAGEYNGRLFHVSPDEKPSPPKKKRLPKKDPDPDWTVDEDVKAELEAMGAFSVPKKYNLRPEVLLMDNMVSPVKKTEKTSKLKRTWNIDEVSNKTMKKTKTILEKSVGLTQEENDLIKLIKQQNTNVEERYRCLDARDKLIRILMKRRSKNVIKSSATVGECPDMCPEKERLMRETQHQVALYEQEEGGRYMNHTLAVKQYSRSSADQEVPLPYELRPVKVLQMTMGYLLHKIVDLSETNDVNLAEWYHFMWDRTRGIRKDITQQELCCQGSVELVEQCARFHIHCSARLVGEEPSVFDQKINTENLTKCLQTLKYLYHDLQLKGESCPNEAEFRAYVILLNLNDGNFMWEVQQLKPEILKSPEVSFALDVYSAIDKNNYVRFFKLVNATTYLNACILMRYFVQVRTTAIKIILKSYGPRKVCYTLDSFTTQLAFDDKEYAINFAESHGILTNEEKTHLILDRNGFMLPEIPYLLDRSYIVESKRISTVGEVICGRILPPQYFKGHIPATSFDNRGYLILNKQYLTDVDLSVAHQQVLNFEVTQAHEGTVEKSLKRKSDSPILASGNKETNVGFLKKQDFTKVFETKPETTNNFAKNLESSNSNMFGVKTEVQKLFSLNSKDTTDARDFSKPTIFGNTVPNTALTSGNIFGGPTSKPNESVSVFRKINSPSIPIPLPSDKKLTQEIQFERPQQVKSIFGGQEPSTFNNSKVPFGLLPGSVFGKDNKNEEREKLRKNLEERQRLLEESKKKLLMEKLEREEQLKRQQLKKEEDRRKLEEAKKRELELREKQELKKEEDETREKKELQRKIQEEIKRKDEERKQRIVQKEKERLQAIEIQKTVTYLVNDMLNEIVENMKKEKILNIQKNIRKRLILKTVTIWKQNIIKNKRKRKAVDCSPMWINPKSLKQEAEELHTINQDLTLKYMRRYKMGVPYEILTPIKNTISKINLFQLTYANLEKRFFDLGMNLQKHIFWKITISLPDKSELKNGLHRIEETLNEIIQWKENNGDTLLIEQHKKNTVQSVTYCIEKQQGFNVHENDSHGIIFIAEDFNVHLQKRLFRILKSFRVLVKIPIVIILQKHTTESQNKLKALIDENILSNYQILIDNFTSQNLAGLLEEGLIFLSQKLEKPPPLELDTLKSFLTKYLCTETWRRANSFTKWNSNYKNCLREPNTVIDLYNECVRKLRMIVLKKANFEFATFPKIFRDYLPNDMPDFLPCNYWYIPDFCREEDYLKKVKHILEQLDLPSFDDKWPPVDESELEAIILKYCEKLFKPAEKIFYRVMSVFLNGIDPNENFENIQHVLWTIIIEVLALEKLNQINFSLTDSPYTNQSIFNQYVVIYNAECINEFAKSDWFYLNNPVIKLLIKKQFKTNTDVVQQQKSPKLNLSSKELDKTLSEITDKIWNQDKTLKIKREMEKLSKLSKDLESSITIDKRISSQFQRTLKQVIDEN